MAAGLCCRTGPGIKFVQIKRLFDFHTQNLPVLCTFIHPDYASYRPYYADWRMLRDVKRRRLFKEYGVERRRINCIRKNTILPDELKGRVVLTDYEATNKRFAIHFCRDE